MKEEISGLKHLTNSTRYSWKGLKAVFKHEAAFRQELIMIAILFPSSFFVAGSFGEWAVLTIPLFTVLIVELLNSAIESIVDRIGEEKHELSGRAKDMGSAAVMVNLFIIGLIWVIFLVDKYLFEIFTQPGSFSF